MGAPHTHTHIRTETHREVDRAGDKQKHTHEGVPAC